MVKYDVPLFGYRYNPDTIAACLNVTKPAEPPYPPHTKPTVMKSVTITFN